MSTTRGEKLLRRWGIEHPAAEQGESAAGYLRARRRMYLPVFVLLLAGLIVTRNYLGVPDGLPWLLLLPATVIASLLAGELTATLRPGSLSTRTAPLVRRRVTDVVPLFGLLAYTLAFLVVLAAVVVNFAAAPWASRAAGFLSSEREFTVGGTPVEGWTRPPPVDLDRVWLLLATLALVTFASGVVVWLSFGRGPVFEDRAVDAALRVRSARVATGCGLALVMAMAPVGLMRIRHLSNPARHVGLDGFPPIPGWLVAADNLANSATTVVLLCGMVVWIALVSPIGQVRLVEAYR